MEARIQGALKFRLDIEISMEELAALDVEERNKILGWVSNSLNKLSLKDIVPALPAAPPRQLAAPNKCRKCGDYYASRKHAIECKGVQAGTDGKIRGVRHRPVTSNGVNLGPENLTEPEYGQEPVSIQELEKRGGSLHQHGDGARLIEMPEENGHKHIWRIPACGEEVTKTLARCVTCGDNLPVLVR